ncbi:MAG: recombination regulator RecX [Azoarcus sp.]|jgi:regulatory protein|nr:recombination regulator RecX [Azoarcus sp.]
MIKPSLRERALRHLARRDHSQAELTRKLAPHGTPEEIAALLEHMGELSLQSDARMAASWIRAHAERFGHTRLKNELARRGVAREIIEEALAGEEVMNELARARAVWRAKFPAAPADAREWARHARFLSTRGFDAATIHAVLRNEPEPEDTGLEPGVEAR